MAFDLAGRVVLQDVFSGTLDLLMGKSREAEGALSGLGAATDAPVKTAKAHIQELEAEVDRLKAKARSGDITPLDIEKFKVTSGALKSAQADLNDVARSVSPVNDVMNAMTLATVGTAAAFGVLGTVMTAVDFAKVGAQALDIERTYGNLAQSAGVAGDELVAAMSKAARGTIDDSDLMLRANRALLSGNKEVVEAYPQLLEGARASALAQGKDVNEVFTAMNEAILRANPRLLAQAGIYLRLGNVMKDYADAHDKAVASLTMEERQAAVLQATLSGVADLERRTGADADSASDQINSLSVAFGQLKEAAGKALVRAGVAEAVGGMAKGIQDQLSVGDMAARYKEQVDKIRSYDKERADQLNAELQSVFLKTQELTTAPTGAKTDEAMIAFYQRRTAAITDEARALEEALNPEVALTRIATANAAARAAAQQKELKAAQAYNDVLDATRDKLSGQAAVSGILGTIAGQIEAIASGLPQLSQMPPNILAVSPEVVQSYRNYIDAAERTGQITAANAVDARKHLDTLQEQQAAIVIGAKSFRDHAAALDYVAQNTIGVTATGKDLLANLQQQPAWIQILVASLVDYDSALKIAQADGARGLNLETRQTIAAMTDVANQAGLLHSAIASIRSGASDELNKLFAQGFPDVSDKIRQVYDFDTALQHIQDTSTKPLSLDLSVLTANIGRLQADSAAGLQTLATAAREAGLIGEASVVALVEGYSKLPPEVQKSIDKLGGLDAALAAINAEAAKPATIDVRVQGLQKALGDIDSMALKLATTLTPDEVRRFLEKARGEVEQHWLKMGLLTKSEQDQALARDIDHYQKLLANQTAADKAAEDAVRQHVEAVKQAASDMKSSVESALTAGSTPTSTQALQAQAGVYQDVAMENARRLDAVTARGFQELKAHPDWATILKIPPEILGGSEAGLKAWAAQTAEDVRNELRPDLIDWEAFGRQYDKIQQAKGAKSLTVAMAVEFLKKSGRSAGKPIEELQKDAAQMLGLENPSITIDTAFQVDPATYGPTVKEWLQQPDGVAKIPAEFVVKPSEIAGQTRAEQNMVPVPEKPAAAENATRPVPANPAATAPAAAVANMPTADDIGNAVARAMKGAAGLGSVTVNMGPGAVTIAGQKDLVDPGFVDRVKSAIADAFGALVSAEQQRPQFACAGLPGNVGWAGGH